MLNMSFEVSYPRFVRYFDVFVITIFSFNLQQKLYFSYFWTIEFVTSDMRDRGGGGESDKE